MTQTDFYLPILIFHKQNMYHSLILEIFSSERGVVWEETIILLPDNVHYVFLSATIPNARQFAEWICHLHKQVCKHMVTGSIKQMFPLCHLSSKFFIV